MRFNLQPLVVVFGSMLVAVWALPFHARNLQGETWILQEHQKTVTEADRNVFQATITDVELGSFLSTQGLHNNSIYNIKGNYKNYNGDSIVMKVLKIVDDEAHAEVKALKGVGEYVDSGMFTVKGKEEPVIIMSKVPGSVLSDTPEYQKAKTDDKEKMKEEAIDLMCKEVAQVGRSKGILHNDNRIENIHVTMSGNKVDSVRLTNWGAYELYTMDKSTAEAEIIAFCKKRWTPVDWFVQADFGSGSIV
ncbi:hypothetical protein DFH05DRAFT_1496544 [Lentinula detonsa]|uniref:Protein kinase domain-containing protein n=1 Tax=Lentinula detonsa TaxID=2804962 RepID=A0A9W8TX67_9AGAR|nr:hypothetical protein DFH05DRAFT_1517779 [Lentinula detonsa]KAJ3743555.1 hypothetical protein DFH05DRAFT_1496544 [Lentinula detonsa]